MLKQLRQKRVMKKVLWALAAIIIPAFVLWGAGGLRDSGNKNAGVVFGKNITFEKYRASYNAVKNIAILTHGSEFQQVRESLNLEQSAWDRLIMVMEAERKGIKVSDEEVVARVASLPVFQTSEGLFNPRNYALVLANVLRTEPRQFEEEMRQSLLMERLMSGIFSGITEPTENEIEESLKIAIGPEETADGAPVETPEEDEIVLPETEAAEPKKTEDQKREEARNSIMLNKRMAAYESWRNELYGRAGLVSYIKPPEEETTEIPLEEPAVTEEIPEP
jgi:hypothetical protein